MYNNRPDTPPEAWGASIAGFVTVWPGRTGGHQNKQKRPSGTARTCGRSKRCPRRLNLSCIAGTWSRPAGCASGNCTTGRFGIWPYRSTTWLAGTRRTTAKAHGWNARPTGISSCFAAPPGMPLTSPASISSSSTSTNSAAVPPHWRDNRRG